MTRLIHSRYYLYLMVVGFVGAAWALAATASPAPMVPAESRTPGAVVSTNAAPDEEESAANTVNIFSKAIDIAQKRCVRLWGAGIGAEHGYGTGIIVSPDGLILTSQSLMIGGPNTRIVLPDGRILSGERISIVRRNEKIQTVLLKVDAKTPDYFDLSDTPLVQKGDWVIPVGNWFKVADDKEQLSAALGNVSLRTTLTARHREVEMELEGEYIVVDAITSNPGAAGGAVLTVDGKLAGMIGKIIESKATNTRINYAVPTEVLRQFVKGEQTIVATAPSSEPGWLGIKLLTLMGIKAAAFVDNVVPNSPAHAAGIRKDDQIMMIDGMAITNIKEYNEQNAKILVGKEITIVVRRKESLVSMKIKPVPVPKPTGAP